MSDGSFYDELAPFISVTLAQARNISDPLERCLKDIERICAGESEPETSDFEYLSEQRVISGTQARAMWYKRRVRPAWTKDAALADLQHHLALAVIRRDHLALHVTDPKLKGPIRAALMSEVDKQVPLAWLSPVPRTTMSAAFLQNGQAKTLWLSGVHRRTATKADAKILAGQDLDYSLDPFDDQSFYWSAARSRNSHLKLTIGVSPRASRVWLGKASTLQEFAGGATVLIDALRSAKTTTNEPFRFLACPVESIDPAHVHGAYDIAILPPDLQDDADEDAKAETALVLESNLIASVARKANVAVEAEINGASIGSLLLEVAIARDGKARFKTSNVVPAGIEDEKFKRLKALLTTGAGVNIRYDSGHSISDRQVYVSRNPRIGFDNFEPHDFAGYKAKQEKPTDLTKIGKEKSLFCWVQNTHKGWLACDDGANEKADFIHLDDSGKKPVLSLIHVKGAKSDKVNRRLSVAAYEVVTGQAVKNLQWLDKEALAKGLGQAVRQTNYWWKDGKTVPKQRLIAAIDALGDDIVRRVVIVQPHVTEAARQSAAKMATGVNRLRLDQLNTLLASAWRSANGLGFEFKVISSA
ncbi:MAG: hypothetical protein K2X72_04360 [Reyranella sp.]|nr:hypothetical protein [Reyranella sp.]